MIYTLYHYDDQGNVQYVSLDVVENFNETYNANTPSYTVEEGFKVSNSSVAENPIFSLSGIVTDSKFRMNNELVVYNDDTKEFEKVNDSNLLAGSDRVDGDKARLVKEKLIELWKKRIVIGIIESDSRNSLNSPVKNHFPCLIDNLSFTDQDLSKAVYPSLTINNFSYGRNSYSKVANVKPELIPKMEEKKLAQSKTSSGSAVAKSKKNGGKDGQVKSASTGTTAKDLLKDAEGDLPKSKMEDSLASRAKKAVEKRLENGYAFRQQILEARASLK
jgi:hypothetical protein